MISRTEEDDIRRIVREEIALDELRLIEQERAAPRSVPPAPGVVPSAPDTLFLSAGEGE